MKEGFWHVIIVVLIVVSTLILLNNQESENFGGFPSTQRDMISVSGTYDLDVAPDEAELMITVETEGANAKEAQDANAAISNQVIDAVAAKKVKKDDIDTIGYYLNKREGYDPKTGRPIPLGYQQTHTMKVKIKNIDIAGDVIDAATDAGANRIENVQFVLSKEKRIESNKEALELAAENAREKAKALASALNVGLGDAISISETNYIFQPRAFDYAAGAAGATMMEKTQVLPGDVTLSLTVNVVFEIN